MATRPAVERVAEGDATPVNVKKGRWAIHILCQSMNRTRYRHFVASRRWRINAANRCRYPAIVPAPAQYNRPAGDVDAKTKIIESGPRQARIDLKTRAESETLNA